MATKRKPGKPTQQRGGKRNGAGRPKSEATIEKERDVKAVALAQPHRRGMALEWLAEPVGRILSSSGALTDKISRTALYESANRFSEKYQRWQSVAGSSRPFANSVAGADGHISQEQADKWRKQWGDAWRALRMAGERQEKAVFAVVIEPQAEDWQPPYWIVYGCIEGLKALADHFGIDYRGEDRRAA